MKTAMQCTCTRPPRAPAHAKPLTNAPSNAVNKDQGKRRNSRHELKTAQLTVPGGGLPAQYTQYLHTLTTSGETRTWNSRVVERAPVD